MKQLVLVILLVLAACSSETSRDYLTFISFQNEGLKL